MKPELPSPDVGRRVGDERPCPLGAFYGQERVDRVIADFCVLKEEND
jgi:hypothetical protein